ncbi:TPA: transposase [Vibrio parahaemolyticus]|nr:transposase [Vibrio parahaemolyticus]
MRTKKKYKKLTRLSEDQRLKLYEEYTNGELFIKDLAARYDITVPILYNIVNKLDEDRTLSFSEYHKARTE